MIWQLLFGLALSAVGLVAILLLVGPFIVWAVHKLSPYKHL
jgi:uncharacterized Tic20 family protein